MTIVDVKNQLISHFFTKDIFTPDDFTSIKLDEASDEYRDELISAALGELERGGVLFKVSSSTKTAYVLSQNLGSFTQQVTLSPGAAEAIAETVNPFRIANEEAEWMQVCDKTNINELDVLNLINIIHFLLDNEQDDAEFESNTQGDN